MVERRLLALSRLTCFVGGLLAFGACQSSDGAGAKGSAAAAEKCRGLEMREVLEKDAGAHGSIHSYKDVELLLGPSNCFGVERSARVAKTERGYGIDFRISPADAERFTAFTVSVNERQVVTVIDGTIISLLTVYGPLPPAGMLQGPYDDWSEAEATRWRDLLIK